METKKYIARQVAGIILPVLDTVLVMAATAVAQVPADSAAYRQQAATQMMALMDLPSPPNISYTTPPQLQAGEMNAHTIKRITPAVVLTTVVGTGSAGSDNGAPLSASFNFPGGIAFDPQSNRYVIDKYNNRIRHIGTGQSYSVSPALPAGFSLDKTTGVISGTPVAATGPASHTVTAYNAGGPDTYTITFSVDVASASTDQNYIMKTTYLTGAPQPDPAVDEAMRDITYFDGLGRPMQEVQVRAVPAKTGDVVVPITYDAYGRMDRDYLPYATATGAGGAFKSGAVAAQAGYYNAPPAGVVTISPVAGTGVTPSFAQRVYEPSPLDRVTEQGFPGAAWQPAATRGTSGRTVSTAYATNNGTAFATVATTRMVSRYGYAVNALGEPTLTLDGTYPAGELYVTITRDENWNGETATFAGRLHTTEEYTDKQGRVVLRRAFNLNGTTPELLSTYYVYNDLGQLSAVLPPEINPDRTGSVPPDFLDLAPYVFGYLYDGRGRVIEKVVPGRNPENYVYNPMGWLVYHQDGRQASETIAGFTPGQYHTFYKYDGIGRVIMKGVERNRTWTRAQIQYHVDTTGIYWEERSEASGNMHGYTNRSNPWGAVAGDMDVLEVHYYDRYDGIPGLPHNESAGYSKLTHGRLVASKVKVLESEPAAYLWTVYYYDDHGRVVREWKQHYLGGSKHTNKFDDILREYTFTGQLKKETRKHYSTSGTTPGVTVTTEHGHDHRERLTHTWKTVNSGTRVLLSKHTYNEVGQLREKGLHSTDGGTTFGQKVRYSYNPRGWLRYTHSDLFRQLLNYGDTTANPQFNGNISHQVFMRRGNDIPPSWVSDTYSYRYDGVNRLIQGTMGSGKGMERLTYSKNGNIKSLQRTDRTGAPVDRLRYDYAIWGNVLASVHDTLLTATPDFQHPGTTYYKYDNNGNMTGRTNGGSAGDDIDTVIYNHLNLPRQVTAVAGNVTYVYDATGRKLRSINAANGQTRDYIGGIEYVGGTMELIHTEDGRITRSDSTYTHHYFLRDHLGNNRAGFIEGTDVTTPDFVADYYPFGLQYLQPIARSGSPKNSYLYNGKELQDGLKQYDYGARFYDPVIGRWGSVDPMAEKYYQISPYVYVANNPIRLIDPDGMDIVGDTLAVERLKNTAQRIVDRESKVQNKLQAKIASRQSAGKSTESLEKRLGRSQSRSGEMSSVLKEIGALEASDQVYNIVTNYTGTTSDGEARYNTQTGAVDVMVSQSYLRGGGLAHELAHAYQFETGQLNFSRATGGPGFLYDIGDEVTAFRRQTAYTNGNVSVVNAGYVRGLKNSSGNLLYSQLPNGPLGTGSNLGTIDLMWRMKGVNPFSGILPVSQLGVKYIDVSSTTFSGFIIK
ncbi:DUF6443 domain-containing protein [Parapedobacter sp. GCM10030251]|uniref:DUF6443 domain-containing protein n=1 Tax=Parapedobacter sp. GCM10030251 TaxID=3273419 RepID=UPI0036071B2A